MSGYVQNTRAVGSQTASAMKEEASALHAHARMKFVEVHSARQSVETSYLSGPRLLLYEDVSSATLLSISGIERS